MRQGTRNRVVIYRADHLSDQQERELKEKYLNSLPKLLEIVFKKESDEECDEAEQLYKIGVFFDHHIEDNWHDISLLCFRLAAEHGSIRAQEHLGQVYESGIKIKTDVDKAKEWYSKASEHGSISAEKRLAAILLKE